MERRCAALHQTKPFRPSILPVKSPDGFTGRTEGRKGILGVAARCVSSRRLTRALSLSGSCLPRKLVQRRRRDGKAVRRAPPNKTLPSFHPSCEVSGWIHRKGG